MFNIWMRESLKGVLIKGITQTIVNETKGQRCGFLVMLLD